MRSNPVAVGVDLGGTHLRVSAVSAEGRILANRVLPSPSADGPEAVGPTVVAQVRDVASQVDVICRSESALHHSSTTRDG